MYSSRSSSSSKSCNRVPKIRYPESLATSSLVREGVPWFPFLAAKIVAPEAVENIPLLPEADLTADPLKATQTRGLSTTASWVWIKPSWPRNSTTGPTNFPSPKASCRRPTTGPSASRMPRSFVVNSLMEFTL